MRIKRFTAPDMRTALRMVREEQGADAVILSNRPVPQGIEVVAATDYDEVLVQQALRNAAAPRDADPKPAPATDEPRAVVDASPRTAPSVRDTLATRARAVFRLGEARNRGNDDEPTLADLTGASPAGTPRPAPSRFDAMMSALADPATAEQLIASANGTRAGMDSVRTPALAPAPRPAPSPSPARETAPAEVPEPTEPARHSPTAAAATATPSCESRAAAARDGSATAPSERTVPHLRAVPDPDPEIVALRSELSGMRKLIEQQVGQLALERLRGSPARAAAYDLLTGYGCDEQLAQQVASRLDPALDPERIHPPMLAELARTLTVVRNEPIDEGGVIALVGPTGAGKTTTVAKLAARFAARHRARDVAMVTTDAERIGAREQLHAHGRRLGITICEAS